MTIALLTIAMTLASKIPAKTRERAGPVSCIVRDFVDKDLTATKKIILGLGPHPLREKVGPRRIPMVPLL